MSESVKDNCSTESLCTVIENISDNFKLKANTSANDHDDDIDNDFNDTLTCSEDTENEYNSRRLDSSGYEDAPNDSSNNSINDSCDTTREKPTKELNAPPTSKPPRNKLKKSVSFDTTDEKVLKFTTGAPIVDQRNPFKSNGLNGNANTKKKKIPPPVPAKRSTLSVRKTVTQQLREREREREKERERLKNEVNQRKTNGTTLASPDEFVTTEEVLKQSKYVKTYIKNPDPIFVYDPTVLARIKFEELREIADKKPTKKLKFTTRDRLKDLKNKPTADAATTKIKLPTFKKCSKPNYPELSDIKVKVGTESDSNFFNPAEVTKNAKKFDERVKKLHIGSDDDLDEIDEPLTKSESSDEVTVSNHIDKAQDTVDGSVMNGVSDIDDDIQPAVDGTGTFTNTIKSREFQEYLQKKGLTLIPKKIPSGAQPMYTNGVARPNSHHISFKAPERVQISIDKMEDATTNNAKKPSVFQRLLSNSIFASRRKTMPKETVPTPRSLYDAGTRANSTMQNGNVRPTPAIKRVVLERQSFHGRPRAGNLLSAADAQELKLQAERSRKSFASGDDLSLSISSALTNAEYANGADINPTTMETQQVKSIAKPPRRTLSRDRVSNTTRYPDSTDGIIRPKVQRAQIPNLNYTLAREPFTEAEELPSTDAVNFRRTLERQSLIPKRTTQTSDKRQVFGRSASMDRNEILRRSAANRGLATKSKSANGMLKAPNNLTLSGEQLSAPKLISSTPIKDANIQQAHVERQTLSPITSSNANRSTPVAYEDQQNWERLRAMKERTDRELYYRVLQQQQQQQRHDAENIYEHLQPHQILLQQAQQRQQVLPADSFTRGSPQRNTFSGVIRNRQAKIIDGKAVMAAADQIQTLPPNASNIMKLQQVPTQTTRSQSVMDGMTQQGSKVGGFRRGYESDSETPVILRRKQLPLETTETQPARRIGGLLTREEILQKVKEFCRKSLNKTPTNQPQMQAIYEKQHVSTDLSPVSYASVETQQQHRPGSRMYASPQVPQRMQSLPQQQQQFVPINQEILTVQNASNASPIYAHVVKRSSVQSNQSELYDSPQRPYLVRRESDAQVVYVTRAPMQHHAPGTQYVIVDNDKLPPGQMLNYHPADLYAQPQYVRPHQLQPMLPGAYGYITVRESNVPQQLRPRLHDGRSTPVILDRSSQQQASQIYWTPQHQRLQQHAGLVPVQISPRYMLKQPYPVAAPRLEQTTNRAAMRHATPSPNIPMQQQQQQFSPLIRSNTPTKQLQQQQLPIKHPRDTNTTTATISSADYNHHSNAYEWESGSEAGEVQRIMEHQRNSGEWKSANIFRNLKTKISRLVGSSKR